MKTAIDSNGLLIDIFKVKDVDGKVHRKGFKCQCCNESVTVAFGPKRQYFRHKSLVSDCIAAKYDRLMSNWHLSWQALFPEGSQEIYEKAEDGSFRRADISYKNYVVEFQHSAITDEEVVARTDFYESRNKKVIWIFDQRKAWTLESDFHASNLQIRKVRLLEYRFKNSASILPRGMAQIDTTKTILFAEISDKKQETTIVRLFRYNNKFYAVNYGKSHDNLVDKIINDELITSLKIEPIPESTKESGVKIRKKVSEEKTKELLDSIRSAQSSSTEEKGKKQVAVTSEPELINRSASNRNLVTITNTSSVDMTRMLDFGLRQIDCYIVTKQVLISEGDTCKIEYTIRTAGQSRGSLLNYLDSLANNGGAPLYGGHFH